MCECGVCECASVCAAAALTFVFVLAAADPLHAVPHLVEPKIERRVDTAFARISCQPLALVSGVEHVMVLTPLAVPAPPPDQTRTGSVLPRIGGRR